MNDVGTLSVMLEDGTTIIVPADLSTISTYVLLERERWFEKEVDFVAAWLSPGMVAIDVGANYGVFSLLMSRLVGPTGRVLAYEPTSTTRAMLARSRAANGFSQLDIRAFALSDGTRMGFLAFGASGELNALGQGTEGETVAITSLDAESAAPGWRAPDFIKIDAEGEEERILKGAQKVLTTHSPLVMFELKAGSSVNTGLIEAFQALGYAPFRQLGGLPLLVPFSLSQPPDAFELNLFAAKPDRVRALTRAGLLVPSAPSWVEREGAVPRALAEWAEMPFAPAFPDAIIGPPQADYGRALAAYHDYRTGADSATRVGGLWYALQVLAQVARRQPTAARLLTLARIAADYGARGSAVQVLETLLKAMAEGQDLTVTEPFWPPLARYETVPVGFHAQDWLRGNIVEALERLRSHSSAFAPPLGELDWLCAQPFASSEMLRRQALTRARRGQAIAIPSRLAQPASDHRNAELWASGRLPGTLRTVR